MQIRELLKLNALQPVTVLTRNIGLERQLNEVVLLEYESLSPPEPDCYEGKLIISSLFLAKDHQLFSTIEQLIAHGAVGLAYKPVYYDTLPEDVIELAQAKDFPILRFEAPYIEDVILSISDYMRQRQEFSLYEDTLFKILQGTWEEYSIEHFCARLNPQRLNYMNAVYIHSRNMASDWSQGLQQSLQFRSNRCMLGDFRFLQFRRGFFVICNSKEEPDLRDVGEKVKTLLEDLGCDTAGLCFGVGSAHQRSENFACVIRDAFDALLFALTGDQQTVLFPELKLYQAVFAFVRDRSSRKHMQKLLHTLITYDTETSSGNLLGTLTSLYQNNYDIQKTASAMCQHPNTIRYRLKKITDLIATPRESAHALYLVGEYLRIDSLINEIF